MYCEPMAIHISCTTVSTDVLLQLGYFLLGGWWQDLHSGHRKTLHTAKHTKSIKKSENPLRGSTSCAAALHRTAHRMTGLGQSLRDPESLMIGGKPRGNLPGSDCGRVCRVGAEVSSTRRQSPWVNLRRSLRVGAWNVLSEERMITCLCYHVSSSVWTSVLQHSLRFGHRIAARSWWVVTPTIGLVALMVTIPKELL